jgi:hypothetical protein
MKTYQFTKDTSRYAVGDLVQFSDKEAEKLKGSIEPYDPTKKTTKKVSDDEKTAGAK